MDVYQLNEMMNGIEWGWVGLGWVGLGIELLVRHTGRGVEGDC
jgi:hypothetical protein